MSRLPDAIITGAYTRTVERPILDLKYGGQFGWAPNLAEWNSNQAYVQRPVICLLLEAPKMFSIMPDSQKWISSLKALFELHPRSIEGMNATMTVDTDEHPVGGGGEMQQEVVNVTRERTKPKFTFVEKYGRPIQIFLDYWIRYGLMDPETKYALLGTLNDKSINDLLADWYTATCLFVVPDPLHRKVDKAWITTNMFPLSSGDNTAKRDLTEGQPMITHDIEFSGLSQFGIGVNQFAQKILDNMTTQGADPFMRPAFINAISPDVEAVNTSAYKSWLETVGRTAVTTMNR